MKLSVFKYYLLIAAVILSGCAHMSNSNRDESLYKTTENYKNSILWGLNEIADNLREAEGSEDQAQNIKRLKKIKVTGYQAVHRQMTDDGNTAKQTVEITYYHTDYMVEKILIDKQVWEYDPAIKVWQLKSGLPKFK